MRSCASIPDSGSAAVAAGLTHPHYRADVDGLRAVAVLSVVGYHAFPGRLPGGFIGVDIFFVISGYLISWIIFGNLRGGTFSFATFYARRIRRIFPALLVVLAACLGLGWFALLAEEYRQLGHHAAGGAAFVSNFVLLGEYGYFDRSADTKPLQHLWSLGIEEQFYILWPLLVWLAWRQRINLLAVTLCVALASFAMNIAQTASDPVAAFYLPLTRLWELLVGSALAYFGLRHTQDRSERAVRSASRRAALGAFTLIAGLVLIDKDSAFPGWWALLPTLGTASIISAGPFAGFNRVVLSNRLLVWFGLISYPLYLWHWPLLSFARIVVGEMPSTIIKAGAVLVAIGLAWMTYKFVEKPIRHGPAGRAKTFALVAAMAVTGIVGLQLDRAGGVPDRVTIEPATAANLFAPYPHEPFHNRYCDTVLPGFQKSNACLLSMPSPPEVVIAGDSHSHHYYKSMAAALSGKSVMNLGEWGCLPFSATARQRFRGCPVAFERAVNFLATEKSIKTVYLAGYWSFLASGGQGLDEQHWSPANPVNTEQISSFMKQGTEVLSRLVASGKDVVIMLGVPDFEFDPRNCVTARGSMLLDYRFAGTTGKIASCSMPSAVYESRVAHINAALRQVAQQFPSVRVFDPVPLFCDPKLCWAMKDGVPLYYDDEGHLTMDGANLVVGDLLRRYPPRP